MIYLRQYNPVILVDIMEALQSGQLKIGKSEIEAWLMTQDVKNFQMICLKKWKATSYKTNDRSVQQRSEESRSASDN